MSDHSLSTTEMAGVAAVASLAAMGAMVPFEFIAIEREQAQLGMALENYAPKVGLMTSTLHGGVTSAVAFAIDAALPPAKLCDALCDAADLPVAVTSVMSSIPAMVITTPLKSAVYLTDRAGVHHESDGSSVRIRTPLGALTTLCGVPGAVNVTAVLSLWKSLGFAVVGALVYRSALNALNALELGESEGAAAEEIDDDVVSVSKLKGALKAWLFATGASLLAYPLDTLRRRAIIIAYRDASARKARRLAKSAAPSGVLERDDAPVVDARGVSAFKFPVLTPLAASVFSTSGVFGGAEKFVLHSAIQAVVAGSLLALVTKVYVSVRSVSRARKTEEA